MGVYVQYPPPSSGSFPQRPNLVYRHDISDGNLTPQVGTYTYTRTGSITVNTSDGVEEFAANVLPLGSIPYDYPTSISGAQFTGPVKNYLLYSEALQTSPWTAIGTGSAESDSTVNPMGTSGCSLITGSALGDGVYQDFGVDCAGKTFVLSISLRSVSGTSQARIRLVDSGTEIGETICPLTTTWRRFEIPIVFTSAASGHGVAQIIVDDDSALAWGAQGEIWDGASVGHRLAAASANPYVRTTSATASTGAGAYVIPNSIWSQCATKGTLSFWHNPWRDYGDEYSYDGQTPALCKNTGVAVFEVSFGNTVAFSINNSLAASTNKAFTGRIAAKEQNVWSLWTFTWDTENDEYAIYKGDESVATTSTVLSAIDIGENDLRIDGGTNDPMDASVFGICLWKVALTAEDVGRLYARVPETTPETGKLFEVLLGDSPIPIVGSGPYKYESYGQATFNDSLTTLVTVPQGTLTAPAKAPGSSEGSRRGMFFQSTYSNLILYSEAPANVAWSVIGTPTVTDSVATAGVVDLGTIDGVSGDGISQACSVAAASKDFLAQVLVSTASGTLNGSILVEGSSGGQKETATTNFTATTTPTWVSVWVAFTAGATGNALMAVKLAATGVLRVGGMMLSQAKVEGTWPTWRPSCKNQAAYAKTEGSVVQFGPNWLEYNSAGNINYKKGTWLAWVAPSFASMDLYAADGPAIVATGNGFEHYARFGPSSSHYWGYGGHETLLGATCPAWTKNTWGLFTATWDATTPGATVLKTYWNTTLVVDFTEDGSPVVYAPTAKNFWIGGMGTSGSFWQIVSNNDSWKGIIDRVEIHGHAFTAQEVSDAYDAHKADYGL